MEEINEFIKDKINKISNITLQLDASNMIDKQIYDKQDVENITLIFVHILWNVYSGQNIKHIDDVEKISNWAIEMWNELYDFVLRYTWIDLRKR